ncbi:MAG: PH domain-containing protein [Wenzhouxiangellaceae bacterium]|nr:PH domain-containing protein [Wenzhouxiangellaceae bacterium]
MNRLGDAGDDWRRLPIAAVGALYVSGLVKLVRENLFVFAGAGTGFAVSDSLGWDELRWVAGGLALGGLVVAAVYHRRFRYLVDDEAMRVRSGLLEQKEIKVRFERVQNIGFSQPLYLKPLKLTRLSLQTPGASQTEVTLPGIATAEAEQLRARISGFSHAVSPPCAGNGLPEEGAAAVDADGDPPGRIAFKARPGDLFRYGLTSNQVWLFAGVFGGALAERIESWLSSAVDWLESAGLLQVETLARAPLIAALMVLGVALLLVAVVLCLSGLLAIVRFHGYELRVESDRFRSRFGLLDAREKTLKHAKLHSLEVVQTALGRLFRRWHVVGHQTGVDAMNGMGSGEQRFLIPGVANDRRDDVLGELALRPWREPEWAAVSRRMRNVFVRRTVAVLGLLMLVLVVGPSEPAWIQAGVAGFALLAAPPLIHWRWRRWGWSLRDDEMLIRSGLVGTKVVRFERHRVQQVRVRQSPYQRRHALASLHIRLPHGEETLPWVPLYDARSLANRVLVDVESAPTHAL